MTDLEYAQLRSRAFEAVLKKLVTLNLRMSILRQAANRALAEFPRTLTEYENKKNAEAKESSVCTPT